MKRLTSLFIALAATAGICAAQEHSYALQKQTTPTTDTTTVLCIGNSFTYYFDTYNILAEIAWSQGHFLDIKNSCTGGYTFGCHLAEPKTLKAMMGRGREGYSYVFLQNQSQLNAFYASDTKRYAIAKKDAKKLVKQIRMFSPKAVCFFESTWAYPKYNCGDFSTMEAFDKAMLSGTEAIAKSCKSKVSPIGNAFAICRERHPEIKLLYKDDHHQSLYGAYLKSCVNYLLIFGGNFAENTSCCTLDKDTAKKLQKAAYDAVQAYKK